MNLNLARRPFANLRPLRRLSIGLWIVGGLAVLASAALFAAYLSRSAEKRGEIARLEESVEAQRQAIVTLRAQLDRHDLAAQNREVRYLNERIAERTFAWSRLFDDLTEVLSWDVRIHSLSPLSLAPTRRDSGARLAPGEVFALRLGGAARDGEALLRFVDRLFAHPAFGDLNLEQERREGADLQFTLSVTYRPRRETAVTAPVLTERAAPGPAPRVPAEAVPPSSPAAAAVAGPVAAPPPAVGGRPAPAPQRFGGQAAGPVAAQPLAAELLEAPAGWSGVQAGTASTAEPPSPIVVPPYGQPLPASPTRSSSAGIRP